MATTKESTAAAPTQRRFDPSAPRKGDRRRELLLDAAEQLLAEISADKLTLDDVAARAGLSRSGVYFYFESKWALLDTLIELRSDELTERALRDADDMSVPALCRQFVEAGLWSWRTHGAVFSAAVERASHGGEATARWRSVMGTCVDAMASQLADDAAMNVQPVGGARTASEVGAWMAERNFYMLFSREHTLEEEDALTDVLVEAMVRMLGVRGT